MLNWLLEVPWWLPTGLICIGAVLLYTGNNRREKALLRGGALLVLLAIVLAAVSFLVDTDREKVIRRTRELVAAVGKGQWKEGVGPLLHANVEAEGVVGREALVQVGDAATRNHPISSANVLDLKAEQHGKAVTVILRVLSEHPDAGLITSTWQLEWVPAGESWLLEQVTLTRLAVGTNEMDAGAVSKQVFGRGKR